MSNPMSNRGLSEGGSSPPEGVHLSVPEGEHPPAQTPPDPKEKPAQPRFLHGERAQTRAALWRRNGMPADVPVGSPAVILEVLRLGSDEFAYLIYPGQVDDYVEESRLGRNPPLEEQVATEIWAGEASLSEWAGQLSLAQALEDVGKLEIARDQRRGESEEPDDE